MEFKDNRKIRLSQAGFSRARSQTLAELMASRKSQQHSVRLGKIDQIRAFEHTYGIYGQRRPRFPHVAGRLRFVPLVLHGLLREPPLPATMWTMNGRLLHAAGGTSWLKLPTSCLLFSSLACIFAPSQAR